MGGPKKLDFFETYFDYVSGATESPLLYHRWSIITVVSTLLNRQIHFPFGTKNIYPNFYTVLVGSAASRKSTAVDTAGELLYQSGFRRIISDRMNKESLLEDLAGKIDYFQEGDFEMDMDAFLEIKTPDNDIANAFIWGSELEKVIGIRNFDLITLLTDLHGNPNGPLRLPKQSKLPNPKNIFISLLGATTGSHFQRMFPPDIISQGTLSRIILVYSGHRPEKNTFPRVPSESEISKLHEWFSAISNIKGEICFDAVARDAVSDIYKNQDHSLDDYRFEHYNERRLEHLIKLCMICAAVDLTKTVTLEHVIYAHTILKLTENSMPKALGEFGDDETSKVAYRILGILRKYKRPVPREILITKLKTDLTHPEKILDAIHLLIQTNKITKDVVDAKVYFQAVNKETVSAQKYIDFTLLREYSQSELVVEDEDFDVDADMESILNEMKNMTGEENEHGQRKSGTNSERSEPKVVKFKLGKGDA